MDPFIPGNEAVDDLANKRYQTIQNNTHIQCYNSRNVYSEKNRKNKHQLAKQSAKNKTWKNINTDQEGL